MRQLAKSFKWQNQNATAKQQNDKQIKSKKILSPKWKFARFFNDRFTPFYPKIFIEFRYPQITRTSDQISITNFSHIPKENIENIPGELTPATFRNLIFTELGNDVKVIIQNEIKEHLKNETPNLDQAVSNFYLKETINTLKEKLNKKEVLIKELAETKKNWQQIA